MKTKITLKIIKYIPSTYLNMAKLEISLIEMN